MTTIKATIKARRLELDAPADWPDGTEVEVHLLGQPSNGKADSMSPEEIAKTLAAMDLVVPFDFTQAEQAALDDDRKARKEREKAQFSQHAEELRREWE